MRKIIVVLAVLLAQGLDAQIYIDSYRFTQAAPTNLLLDDYPGAAAAYSLRKLDKDYTGNAIEIRRSNDNATAVIGFDANGNLDVTAIASHCTTNTCYVTTWYDQSGSENHATASVASQPTIYTGGAIQISNGKPALNLDGSNDFLFKGNLNITQPFSVFITFEEKSRATTNPFFDSESPRSTVFASSSTQQIVVNSGTTVNGGILTIAPHIISSVHDGSSSYLNVDGTNRFTNQNIGANDIGDLAIGWNNGGNKLAFANMYMSEFIVYSSNQIANISNIESNINSYYSIY